MAWQWVLVCVLAYVGSVLHFALVQHTTCLEHGDVMHVSEAPAHVEEEVSFDDARVARAPQAQAVPHSAEAHCHHAFMRREATPPAGSAPTLVAVSTRSSPALAVFRFHAAPVALLRLAPKSSPPRA
ncbi:MAG: hypothetical protein EOO71_41015 [Myxococcaceae bacterium]|nr:MAG: hypothetical protein EOO71_41015 [Myxococcaceae bacterium]